MKNKNNRAKVETSRTPPSFLEKIHKTISTPILIESNLRMEVITFYCKCEKLTKNEIAMAKVIQTL